MTLCRHYSVVDWTRHVVQPTLTVDYRKSGCMTGRVAIMMHSFIPR